jgi:antirestriction protein
MNDKDQEVLNRFHLYSQRFLQYSVAEEVYLDTLAYIKQLIEERDEARREAMLLLSERSSAKEMREEYRKRGWSYLLSKEKQ